jgi:hypothetical protein
MPGLQSMSLQLIVLLFQRLQWGQSSEAWSPMLPATALVSGLKDFDTLCFSKFVEWMESFATCRDVCNLLVLVNATDVCESLSVCVLFAKCLSSFRKMIE